MSKLKPKNGYLVLRPIEEDETMYGNIIIPDLGKERPELGEVIATSPTYNFHSDQKIPSEFKIGDKVLIPKLGSVRITVDSEEYFICKEQDVYSILVDEDDQYYIAEINAIKEPKIY
jgi:chaperonin GroES